MIVTVFGKPGAGKTTLLSYVVQQNERRKRKYYKKVSKNSKYIQLRHSVETVTDESEKEKFNNKLNKKFPKNFYDVIYCTDETIQGTIPIDYEHLGDWKPAWNSLIMLEEAGLGINSREYKHLSKNSKRLAAMHRHSGADILIVSQSVDIDKAYRQRSELMLIARKLGELTILRKITYSVDVDEMTHDLVDAYAKQKPLWFLLDLMTCKSRKNKRKKEPFKMSMFIWRPFYYKFFDSFVDDFDYPMEDPYITWLKEQEKPENLTKELIKEGLL